MGAAVVLMHTLRMRRREREVSSLFLWQLASRAMAADHRRHRLIKSLILLVQLLVIELLAAALAGPQFHRNGAAVHLGVIVDTSASMAAGSGETRAGEAVAALERFLSEGEAARYILWSTTGTLLRYDGPSKEQFLRALYGLPPPGGSSDWDAVSREVAAAVQAGSPLLIVLVTDGGWGAVPSGLWPALGSAAGTWVIPVGSPLDNAAITRFSARATGRGAGHHQVMVEVENFGTSPVEGQLVVTSTGPAGAADDTGQPAAAFAIRLEPRGRRTYVFEHTFRPGEVLAAELDTDDAFALDNTAYLAAAAEGAARVLWIGEDNHFLREGLVAAGGVEIERALDPRAALERQGEYDLAVFYGEQPPAGFAGAALVFAAGGDSLAPYPALTWWDRRHPLFRFVDWESVSLAAAAPVPAAPGEQVLLDSTAGPLITVAGEGARRVVRVGIPLEQSDFPFRVAFPVFLQNALEWANPRGQELVPPPSPLGKLPEPVAALLRSGETIHLTTPLEEHAELAPGQAEGDGLYRLLLAPGVYAWRAGSRTGQFALSLLDRTESDLASRWDQLSTVPGVHLLDPAVDRLVHLAAVSRDDAASAPGAPLAAAWSAAAVAAACLLLLEERLYTARGRSRAPAPGLLASSARPALRRGRPGGCRR